MISNRINQLKDAGRDQVLLFDAVLRQDTSTTSALLERGVSPDFHGPNGRGPIHEAAISGNMTLIIDLSLHSKYSDFSFECTEKKTVLDYASSHGRANVVLFLLDKKRTNFSDTDIALALTRAMNIARLRGHQELTSQLEMERSKIERAKKLDDFARALEQNDIIKVEILLKDGISKPYALAIALDYGFDTMFYILINSMADGHVYDVESAINKAAAQGKVENIRLLLQKVTVGRLASVGRALMIALRCGHRSMSKELVHFGNVTVGVALESFAIYRDLELVQWLVELKKAEIHSKSLNRAFHSACVCDGIEHEPIRHLPLVEFLLESGADVNSEGDVWANTIQMAAANGQDALIELLIKHGGDLNAKGKFGGSNALMAAVSAGRLSTVKLLLSRGAIMENQRGLAGNMLQTACYLRASKDIITELLDHGISINACLEPLGTPLMIALQRRHQGVAELLLSKGADVTINIKGYGTALHLAATQGAESIVKLLVDFGANVNAEGGDYGTALQAAAFKGHSFIVMYLLDCGADVNRQGGRYENAFNAAKVGGHNLLAKLLLLSGARVTKGI